MNLKKLLHYPGLKIAIKFIFVVVLLGFLMERGFLSLDAIGNAFSHPNDLIPAFLCLLTSTLLGVLRWHLLLRVQQIHLHGLRTLELSLIGNFFNIALPGAVSGDVVKAVYVAKEAEGKRAHALSSILFDRVVGVSALVLVSAVSMALSFVSPVDRNMITALEYFVSLAGVSVILFFIYLFSIRDHHDPLLKLLKYLENWKPFFGSFLRIYEGVRVYHRSKAMVLVSLGISIVIHLLMVGSFYGFLLALNDPPPPGLGLFIVVPLGLLITAIPITPAGVGTGHAAFLFLFKLLGSQRGADAFTLLVFFNLTIGIIGGLVYLRFKSVPVSLTNSRSL